ncbi:MAG TPA: DDE-type integrase/transposase/recombinase [Pirellulaceae bacterium]|nr:DDE-type integrase/transposase/recombinase [Pirellulaceae bacterium]
MLCPHPVPHPGGTTWQRAAGCLQLSARTLRHWRAEQQQAARSAPEKPRGRPVIATTAGARNEVFRFLQGVTGPMVGVPTLHALFPEPPGVVLATLLTRYRRWWRNKHAVHGQRLTWHVTGAVWAMDFTKTKHPIDGATQIIFTVRDLASHYHLCWLPVADETASTIIPILQGLFAQHGSPLVLKSDNGSAFIAEDANDLLKVWDVLALFSPPRQPKYNGALERSNTTLKVYTHTSAVSDGHPFRWTSDNLAKAVTVANEFSRPWGASGQTPAVRWRSRAAITEQDRCQLSELVEAQREVARVDLGFTDDPLEELSAADRRAVDRMAIASSLRQLGHLTTKAVRHLARKPKRPDSEHRGRWFEEQPRASDATPAMPSPARCAESDSSACEKKSLAHDEESATMPACPTVSSSSAATPHDLPPTHCAWATFDWLRRPIAPLLSLAKAAKIK